MTTLIDLPTLDPDVIASRIGIPFAAWACQCHAISLAVVKAGILPGSRVARGSCREVPAQHSWIVVGDDCYAPDAVIVDPTLWSYDPTVTGIWTGTAEDGRHVPHGGHGDIWDWGRPTKGDELAVSLHPEAYAKLSPIARGFLTLLGPLDRRGWANLADAPVRGWPAAEIIEAMYDTPEIQPLIPIDRVGMLTDRNPRGLYR